MEERSEITGFILHIENKEKCGNNGCFFRGKKTSVDPHAQIYKVHTPEVLQGAIHYVKSDP